MKKLVGTHTMARFTSINHPSISSKLKQFLCNNSEYAIIISYHIIDLFISYFGPEKFWRKGRIIHVFEEP